MNINDLSWKKTSFSAKLTLFFKSRQLEKQKIRSGNRWEAAAGYSALSSTYYSIVGTAFSQLKLCVRPVWLAPFRIALWCLTWLPLALWCYWRMLPLSNQVERHIGYAGMSADQCDVRQSILRRRGRYEEARACIDVGLAKNSEKAHTRGLLCIGRAEIHRRDGQLWKVESDVSAAISNAQLTESYDRAQAARIYRHCAKLLDHLEKGDTRRGNRLRQKADELARAAGAGDQLLKQK